MAGMNDPPAASHDRASVEPAIARAPASIRHGPRGWRHAADLLAAPLLLLAIIVGFYWKLTLTRQYTWLDDPDLAYQVLPWL